MMRSTDQLKDEHRVIEQVLAFYQAVAKAAAQGRDLPVEALREAVEFTRSFADQFHHAKEEGVLFQRLEQAGMPREVGPVGVMLMEHDEGRGYVASLAEGVERYASGDHSAAVQVGEAAGQYADLLAQHIHKEDNILYMMADQLLAGQDDQILEAYGDADRASMNEERRQRFLDIAERLGKQAESLGGPSAA
jgi:hemerythrin-like domain-containing protein